MHFLENPDVFCGPFLDYHKVLATDINMFSDATKSGTKGFGAICENSWMFDPCDKNFINEKDHSIEYLELYAVTAGVLTWINRFKNKRIYLFCDNDSAVHMINN